MLLRAIGVTKSYERRGERFFAANGVDLCVGSGDFVCITGRSGSGKSTLLNMLTGLLRADSGEIIFDGVDLCSLGDARLAKLRCGRIGYVPQGNSLLQNFSVLDNVRLPLCLARKGGAETKKTARELLSKVGISHLEGEFPRSLSGGEARRAAIARSLAADPALLVADEPTGDLDPASADAVMRLFSQASARGAAVIVVTHDRQIPPGANRCLVMSGGRLEDL
ncbi:MAG: ABC transporter ATP-binding protein [Oscillospiraceae bacterium]|jgi:putative ABC transport system ATP-binding protein|nr:ABC transporter ATP-binding protein [Oscillospiraceae bacterium]